MSNAFLVEMIFNWPGSSRYGINTMLRKDLNAIAGVVLTMGVVFIVLASQRQSGTNMEVKAGETSQNVMTTVN